MTRMVFLGFWLVATCAGCVALDTNERVRPQDVVAPAAHATAVTPDQVNLQNAHQVSQALWDEMDRSELSPGFAAPPAAPGANAGKAKVR